MSAEELRARVGGSWTERKDGWWVAIAADEVRAAVAALRAGGARFAALVGRPASPPRGGLRLSWHFDVRGTLLTLDLTLPAGAEAPSVVDLYPGADWAEREARDYYAVTFAGRAETAPLMLREGDAPGVLLPREGERP